MVCRDCGWEGYVSELLPQVGDEYGNDLCPSCGGMDVITREDALALRIAGGSS